VIPPEISLFGVIPTYTQSSHIDSLNISYELFNPADVEADVILFLEVEFDGHPIEERVLFKGDMPPKRALSSQLNYVPASGWISGKYAFLLICILVASLCQSRQANPQQPG